MAKRHSTTDECPDPTPSPTTPDSPDGPLCDLIEDARTRLMTAVTMLGCTSVAINHDRSVPQHQLVYSEVIDEARSIISETTNRLDSAQLQPFYDQWLRANRDISRIEQRVQHGLTFEIRGHLFPFLTVDPSLCDCGDIKRGVGFSLHTGNPDVDRGGCWVLAFADFERAYKAARAKRGVRA